MFRIRNETFHNNEFYQFRLALYFNWLTCVKSSLYYNLVTLTQEHNPMTTVIRLPGTFCEICGNSYREDGWGRKSQTFGFCCSRCVSKACRVVRRHNRRARSSNASGILYAYQWLTVQYSHNFSCASCSTKSKSLTLDHIRPLSKGGPNLMHNIQPLCRSCHDLKDNIRGKNSCNTV